MNKIVLLFAAVTLSWSCYCQQKQIDSFEHVLKTAKDDTNKVIALNKLASIYLQGPTDYKKALLFAEKSQQLAEKLSYKKGVAFACMNLGAIYGYYGLYQKAFADNLNALKIWEALKDSGMIIQSYRNLSFGYSLQGNFKKALEIDLMLEKIAKRNNDKQKIIYALWALEAGYSNFCKQAIARGDSMSANYNYNKAIEYILRALKITKDIKDSNDVAILYNSEGYIYDKCNLCEENNLVTETNLIKSNYYSKAKESYFKSLEIYQKLNDEGGISVCYSNLGLFYRNQGNLFATLNKVSEANINYQKSLEYYLKAFEIIKKLGYKHGVANYSKELGNAYLKLGEWKDAQTYLLNAAAGFEEIGFKEGAKESYELLSEVSLKEKDYKNAFEYYKDFSRLKDSLLNEETEKQLTETEIKYETEKKDNEISLLNKDKQIEESKIKQQSRDILLIASIAILLIAGVLIYIKFKQNKTALHLKDLQQKALRAQLNPHFIFNAMQSIQRGYAEHNKKGEELLINFSSLIREVLNNSFLSEGTLEEEIELIKKYLNVESQRLTSPLNLVTTIEASIHALEVSFPSMALQPVFENAVKYGAANNIVLNIKQSGRLLIISIENNLPENYASNIANSGVGLNLTKERINLFNRKYKAKGGVETEKINNKFITTIRVAYVTAQPELA